MAPATVPVSDLLEQTQIDAHFEQQRQPVDAVPTPLPTWNNSCHDAGGGKGLARGWHITIAGNTGQGKSLLALNMAAEAIRHGEQVGFLSIEMGKAQVRSRLYAILTGTDVRKLERGEENFDPAVRERVKTEIAALREGNRGGFVVNEDPVYDVDDAVDLMGNLFGYGCGYFITDYLQLLGACDADSLFRQVSEVSARIREFAATHNVVSVAVSQFNRQTSSDYTARPKVQGLMASSSIENDSDQVLLLDHTRYQRNKAQREAKTWAILGKNRHGQSGPIPVEWDFSTLRIREARPDEEAAWP